MWALRMVRQGAAPELVQVPVPEPAPGEVLVRVGGAGVCHSDIHLLYGERALELPLPFTLGHETAGWVEAVGDGVTRLEVGVPVAIYGPTGCGSCSQCASGAENYCPTKGLAAPAPGICRDGGMAEFLLVPSARFLVPLPDGLTPDVAAPLTDAALTPYHAIRRAKRVLRPGATAVVIGAGGLGHLAIQILKATTAVRVIAVDRRPEALELAKRCGADAMVEPGPDGGTDGIRQAAAVFDFVGSAATVKAAAAMVGMDGHIGLVGAGDGVLPVSRHELPIGVSSVFTYWGGRPDLIDVLSLAARRDLVPITEHYGLSRSPEAYAAVRAGTITGRAVVVPG